MEYYDWLIISFALIMIGFLTLLGLAIFETSLKNTNWVLWFSIGGLILFIFLTGFTIWYFKGKGSNKRKKELKINNREDEREINKRKKELKINNREDEREINKRKRK